MKQGHYKITILICVLFLCLILPGCENEYSLYHQVKDFADKSCEDGDVSVALSDLTGFDWDEALVFRYPTTRKEIEDALGVQYQGSVDLTSGIIFVKDKKIVYDETFPTDFESKPRFFIYPHKDQNVANRPNFTVFTPESVFMCSKTESKDRYCYSLVPSE